MFATHSFIFGLQEKLGQGREAFIDDQACERYAEKALASLERRLTAEQE